MKRPQGESENVRILIITSLVCGYYLTPLVPIKSQISNQSIKAVREIRLRHEKYKSDETNKTKHRHSLTSPPSTF